MSPPLAQLQQRLAHAFRHPELLERALTHPSYLHDHPAAGDSNQRLEFLGDAVLQLILTAALCELYPADREGALSQRRAALTKGPYLAQLARQLGLETALRLGAGEEQTGGRTRASNLEDAFEALVGALYLDTGLDDTRRIVLALYGPLPAQLDALQPGENPKGRLQELVQPLHGNNALRYDVIATHGEDHAREYDIQVSLLDRPLGTGRGKSKKAAEEAAARMALETLRTAPPATP